MTCFSVARYTTRAAACIASERQFPTAHKRTRNTDPTGRRAELQSAVPAGRPLASCPARQQRRHHFKEQPTRRARPHRTFDLLKTRADHVLLRGLTVAALAYRLSFCCSFCSLILALPRSLNLSCFSISHFPPRAVHLRVILPCPLPLTLFFFFHSFALSLCIARFAPLSLRAGPVALANLSPSSIEAETAYTHLRLRAGLALVPLTRIPPPILPACHA